MLDIEDFKSSLRDFLLADTGVSGSVSARIYFTNFFTLINPTFPLINLELFEGRNIVQAVDRIGVNVFCSSKVSYDEADSIFTLTNSLINTGLIKPKIVCRLQITPINRLIEKPIPIYQTIGRYTMFYIN